MFAKILQGEFTRFLLVGATNTLLSYLLYLFLLKFVSYLSAYTIAYCFGIIISYFSTVYFVFKNHASLSSFIKFPAVYVIQYCLGAGFLWLLVDRCELTPFIAMIGAIVLTIPITFLASRLVLTK